MNDMFAPPPYAKCVAEQRVMPTQAPPFEWSVFVTPDEPEDTIAFYSILIGRQPDAEGCKWCEPVERPLHTVEVRPANRTDVIPPDAREDIPPDARSLIFIVHRDAEPLGEPYQSNVLPRNLSPASLLEATQSGELTWAASKKGPVFKAGGRVPDGLHSGTEIWITLSQSGKEYILALTSEQQPYGDAVRQKDGLLRSCELGKLWAAIEKSTNSSN